MHYDSLCILLYCKLQLIITVQSWIGRLSALSAYYAYVLQLKLLRVPHLSPPVSLVK